MAINPIIPLSVKSPDIGATFSNALMNIQKIDQIRQQREQAPMQNQLLQAQVANQQAQQRSNELTIDTAEKKQILTDHVQRAMMINTQPTMEGKMRTALAMREQMAGEGAPANMIQGMDNLLQIGQQNPEEFQQIIDNVIQMGRQFGVTEGASATQFGAQETFKDTEGNLFFGTTARSPTGGGVQTVLAPVDPNGPREPVGKVEIVGQYGLTAGEQVQQKAKEAGAKKGAEIEAETKLKPKLEAEVTRQRKIAEEEGALFTELQQMEAALPMVKEAVNNLRQLAPLATHTLVGQGVDALARELGFGATEGATARAKYISIIRNQVLPLLKPTFGAAFTVQEGEKLEATLGDPDLGPEEKLAQLEAFMEQKERDIRMKSQNIQKLQPAATKPQVLKFDAQGNLIQ